MLTPFLTLRSSKMPLVYLMNGKKSHHSDQRLWTVTGVPKLENLINQRHVYTGISTLADEC